MISKPAADRRLESGSEIFMEFTAVGNAHSGSVKNLASRKHCCIPVVLTGHKINVTKAANWALLKLVGLAFMLIIFQYM